MRQWLLGLITLIFLIAFPLYTQAAQFRSSEDQFTLSQSETINDDLYVSSGNIQINGTINGDLFIAGGQANINGNITGDLFVAAGSIAIDGTIGDDLRVLGGSIQVNGTVKDDLMVAGGDVRVGENANIGGAVYNSSGQLTIAGTTGPVIATVGNLSLTNTARISGDLTYTSSNRANITQGAVVTGQTTQHQPPIKPRGAAALLTTVRLLSFLTLLVIALLLLLIFPSMTNLLSLNWRQRFGLNLLWGFIYLIIIPIAAIILMVTIVGIPLGIGALLLYPIIIYLGTLVGVIALGTLINSWWVKDRDFHPTWLTIIIGVVVYSALRLIPLIGWLIDFIIVLVGIGAFLIFAWSLLGKLRQEKII